MLSLFRIAESNAGADNPCLDDLKKKACVLGERKDDAASARMISWGIGLKRGGSNPSLSQVLLTTLETKKKRPEQNTELFSLLLEDKQRYKATLKLVNDRRVQNAFRYDEYQARVVC